MMIELQIGHSIFQPLNENQLDLLAEKLNSKQESALEKESHVEEK